MAEYLPIIVIVAVMVGVAFVIAWAKNRNKDTTKSG